MRCILIVIAALSSVACVTASGGAIRDDYGVTAAPISYSLSRYDWYSNIIATGAVNGTKLTSPDGFHMQIDVFTNIFEANGTLTTTLNNISYYQPCNAC